MANVRAMTVKEARCLVEESAEYNEYFDRTTSVFNEAIRDAAKSGDTSVIIYSPMPNHQYIRYLNDVIGAFRANGFKVLKHEIVEDTAYTTVEWGD